VIFADKSLLSALFRGLSKAQLPKREPRNKMMRIGLHGLCGYIKLERGRAGGAKGAYTAQAGAPGCRYAAEAGEPRSGSQTNDAGRPPDKRGGETAGDRLV
jgi:hypothetical protein